MIDQRLSRRSLLAGAGGLAAAPARRPPNVLFFFADELRVQSLGYAGDVNVPTPNIDRLASQGVSFTNALSSCPLCTPYRAMLQTGRWPRLSGGVFNHIDVPGHGQAVADLFSRSGYHTGFIGKWHLAAGALRGALKRGERPDPDPESSFVPPGPGRMGYRYWAAYNFHANFAKAFYYRDTSQRLWMARYETDSETDMAIEFMRPRIRENQPFFLMVAPHPPHGPWTPAQTPAGSLDRVAKTLTWRKNVRNPGGREAEIRCYYAMTSNIDENIGRLMRFLDESGAARDTIVVLSSDHGNMLGSRGLYTKLLPYEESVGIPTLIRWPGRIPAGSKTDALLTPMDYYPTLAGFCGLKTPATVNGLDLSGFALDRGGPQREAALMGLYSSHFDYPETGTIFQEWRAVRTRSHSYVRWMNGNEELYDLNEDPYQLRNLLETGAPPAVAAELREQLASLLRESHDDFGPGTEYATWLTPERKLIRNALGPIGEPE